MSPRNSSPVVLCIGGSDSSAGAGIQADLKTAAAMGAWCHTVLTAVTAQTPLAVTAVFPLDTAILEAQISAIMALENEAKNLAPQVLKVGMLASEDQIRSLATLQNRYHLPMVVDTVMKASSGAELGARALAPALVEYLTASITLLTPNLPEAAAILGKAEARSPTEMCEQARSLRALGFKAVLLKGGHLSGGKVVDVLVSDEGETFYEDEKLCTPHTHGSGCTLATAIAVGLAKRKSLVEAIKDARSFVRQAILNAIEQAKQQPFVETNGPLLHFKRRDDL